MAVDFNIDLNEYVRTIFQGVEDRNDLLALIQNGSKYQLTISWEIQHGNLERTEGSALLDPPDFSVEEPKANVFALGVDAAGRGSNIMLYITSGERVWGFLLVTPPNRVNYVKGGYWGWPKAKQDVLNYLNDDNIGRHTSNDGPWRSVNDGVEFTTWITGTSPAQAPIQFVDV
jgi:hypothetical protein